MMTRLLIAFCIFFLVSMAQSAEIRIPAGFYIETMENLQDSTVYYAAPGDMVTIMGNPAVLLTTERAITFRNFHFRARPDTGITRVVSVTKAAENIRFEDCEFWGGTSCISISRPNCTLIRCRIHGATSHGVYVSAHDRGGLNNGSRTPDSLQIIDCMVYDCGKWGLHFNNEDWEATPTGMYIEGTIVNNCGGGLVIAMGIDTVVRDCEFRNNRNGVWVGYKDSEGTLFIDCVSENNNGREWTFDYPARIVTRKKDK